MKVHFMYFMLVLVMFREKVFCSFRRAVEGSWNIANLKSCMFLILLDFLTFVFNDFGVLEESKRSILFILYSIFAIVS